MRQFVCLILFFLTVSLFFADTIGILSTTEMAQLVDMLDSAGFLIRLSDSFALVHNPTDIPNN